MSLRHDGEPDPDHAVVSRCLARHRVGLGPNAARARRQDAQIQLSVLLHGPRAMRPSDFALTRAELLAEIARLRLAGWTVAELRQRFTRPGDVPETGWCGE